MGKVIRCVDCQTPIIIPDVESPLLRTGNWVECRAKRAIKKSENGTRVNPAEKATSSDSMTKPVSTAFVPSVSSTNPPRVVDLPLNFPRRTARLLRAKPWRTVEPLTHVDPEDVLTPLELDIASSSAVEPVEELNATLDPELSKADVDQVEHQQSQELSLIGKLLLFVNPFAKDQRRSA